MAALDNASKLGTFSCRYDSKRNRYKTEKWSCANKKHIITPRARWGQKLHTWLAYLLRTDVLCAVCSPVNPTVDRLKSASSVCLAELVAAR